MPRIDRKRRSFADRLADVDLEFEPVLVMPVRFSVDGTDLFACSGSPHIAVETINDVNPTWLPDGHRHCAWTSLPIVDLAAAGLRCVRRAKLFGRCAYGELMYGSSVLTFEMEDGDRVRIWSGVTDRAVVASYAEVLAAFEGFVEEVGRYLLERLPELAQHRRIGAWLVGGASFVHD
jgi:hypothetical protein